MRGLIIDYSVIDDFMVLKNDDWKKIIAALELANYMVVIRKNIEEQEENGKGDG